MKMKINLFGLLFLMISTVSAQIIATSGSGTVYLLNPDGTWIVKPYEPAGAIETKSTSLAPSNCIKYISTEYEKVSGTTTTGAIDFLNVLNADNKYGFKIFLFNSQPIAMTGGKSNLVLNIDLEGASPCIDDDAIANILFRDGTRLELRNYEKYNCKGRFVVYFGEYLRPLADAQIIGKKEIDILRVWTVDGYVEKSFTANQSEIFMKTISCLIDKL